MVPSKKKRKRENAFDFGRIQVAMYFFAEDFRWNFAQHLCIGQLLFLLTSLGGSSLCLSPSVRVKFNASPEDETVGCHHRLDGREFEWTPGVGDGQGGLACCVRFMGSQRVGHDWATELNWTETWSLFLVPDLELLNGLEFLESSCVFFFFPNEVFLGRALDGFRMGLVTRKARAWLES